MRELSLFTGTGGGIYGSKLLGWQTLGYVEWNEYCQKVIRQRIKDGIFDEAPIFGDISHFIESGAARQYRGFVDMVSAGFPCQGYSQAGSRKGEHDERNRWPETLQVLRATDPEHAWLENVPALLNFKYFQRILSELAEIFPSIRGACVGNNEIGSGVCNGERVWLFATKADCPVLESMDFQKYQKPGAKESFRWQHSRAIGAMLQQDDYTRIKRDIDAITAGKQQLKAIGNTQNPYSMACAFKELSRGVEL